MSAHPLGVPDAEGHIADAVRDGCLTVLGKVVGFEDSNAIAAGIVERLASLPQAEQGTYADGVAAALRIVEAQINQCLQRANGRGILDAKAMRNTIAALLTVPGGEQQRHASHTTRSSDSSAYDEVCVNCGATDIAGAGWGELAKPCAKAEGATAAEVPLMLGAFRTTFSSPAWRGSRAAYEMRFSFRSMAELHAADDEWIKFCRAGEAAAEGQR